MMRFDPKATLTLPINEPIKASRFIEIDRVHTPSRAGWATPRRRPRRVHRKLTARGYAAHYGGPGLYGAVHYRIRTLESPELRWWLDMGSEASASLAVDLGAVVFDGEKVEPLTDERAKLDWFDTHLLPNRPLLEAEPTPVTITVRTFEQKAVVLEHGVATRTLRCWLRVFVPNGISPEHPIVEKFVAQRVGHFALSLLLAAMPRTLYEVPLARQTSYR